MRPARDTLVMLLAGGVGSRLNILASERAKPAVPFGGGFRIIDFTLSNVMHSGLELVGLLTQYRPLSLMDHVRNGEPWDLIGRARGVRILPPHTGGARGIFPEAGARRGARSMPQCETLLEWLPVERFQKE